MRVQHPIQKFKSFQACFSQSPLVAEHEVRVLVTRTTTARTWNAKVELLEKQAEQQKALDEAKARGFGPSMARWIARISDAASRPQQLQTLGGTSP